MGKKIVLFVLIIVLVFGGIGTGAYFILKEKKNASFVVTKKETNTIEGYQYTLDNLDSELYVSLFGELKEILTSDDVDMEAYAKTAAKMFIVDFYTLKSKVNKYDVGGLEFILKSNHDNFIANATDTVYKYVEDNSNDKRTQTLPVVKSIEVTNIESTKFKINETEKEYFAYKVNLSWEYTNDLGYDKEAEVVLINENDILYVVEKN